MTKWEDPVSQPADAPKVLIVDDDEGIRALAQWVVVRAGFQALTARDGPEALDRYRTSVDSIRLVLLDLTMPRMTGAEVVAGLQQIRKGIPVVLITGYGAEAVRDEEKVGVSGILQKPFKPEDLRRVLDHFLKTPSSAEASTTDRVSSPRVL